VVVCVPFYTLKSYFGISSDIIALRVIEEMRF
jgi:hypothetical protein